MGLFVGLSIHRPQPQCTSDGDLERTGNSPKNIIIAHIFALHFELLQHCRLTKVIALLTKLELPQIRLTVQPEFDVAYVTNGVRHRLRRARPPRLSRVDAVLCDIIEQHDEIRSVTSVAWDA